jgi:hypothetical protein
LIWRWIFLPSSVSIPSRSVTTCFVDLQAGDVDAALGELELEDLNHLL